MSTSQSPNEPSGKSCEAMVLFYGLTATDNWVVLEMLSRTRFFCVGLEMRILKLFSLAQRELEARLVFDTSGFGSSGRRRVDLSRAAMFT